MGKISGKVIALIAGTAVASLTTGIAAGIASVKI